MVEETVRRARERARGALVTGALGGLTLMATGCFRGDFFAQTCRDGEVCTTSTQVALETIGDGTQGSTDTGPTGPESDPRAYRIDSLALIDPHVYLDAFGPCADATETLNTSILVDTVDDEANSAILAFDDYSTALGSQLLRVYSASCDGGVPASCSPKGNPELLEAELRPSGSCRELDATTISPANLELLNDPDAPCFATAPTSFVLPISIGGVDVLLQDGQLAVRPEPFSAPIGLVDGVLWGFIPQGVAEGLSFEFGDTPTTLWALIAGGGGCTPQGVMISDVDEHAINGEPTLGVWFYMNFTAARATWEPDQGGTDSDSDSAGTDGSTTETGATDTDAATDATSSPVTTGSSSSDATTQAETGSSSSSSTTNTSTDTDTDTGTSTGADTDTDTDTM
ncbi:MAG: hypothetical protein H6713_29780 [Myxococcales bacterium]|nr:hypothetical protein [Myxococcales bacterium]MCB9754153.1 hypothetical protein [Myxococcales bacterium]